MRKLILTTVFTAVFITVCSFNIVANRIKIVVIADLHYTHPSLIVEWGEAFDHYLNRELKLLVESDAILRESVNSILQESPDIVLVPGDLTKDGELVGHLAVAELLRPLHNSGIKVLVVPGNHDINNPLALSYHGDSVCKVPTISPEQFLSIYQDYGYGRAVSRDEHSLSYVSEPVNGLRVISIDANQYYNNQFLSKGDKKDRCINNGYIKPETMQWLRTEMQVARVLNKKVIAMMHHNVVEHFAHQGVFAVPYMVDDFRYVQQKFLEFGITVLFTGHFHSTDISMVEDRNGNILYEVETGSIITYPCPYRVVEIDGDSISIETKFIEKIDYPLPEGVDFQSYAEQVIKHGFKEVFNSLIDDNYHTFSQYLPGWTKSFIRIPEASVLTDIVMRTIAEPATEMLVAHNRGNEDMVIESEEKREKTISALDSFITATTEVTAGRLAAIGAKIIKGDYRIKKAKETIASIWGNDAGIGNDKRVPLRYGKEDDLKFKVKFHFETYETAEEYLNYLISK